MGLADDLRAPSPVNLHRGQTCSIHLLFDELNVVDPDGAEALREVLETPKMQSTVIARRLNAAGYTVSVAAVQRHRRQECRCPN